MAQLHLNGVSVLVQLVFITVADGLTDFIYVATRASCYSMRLNTCTTHQTPRTQPCP
jgi:hypothetical protein